MVNLTIKEIGSRLRKAGKLEMSPLCVYGSESMPQDAVSSCKLDRCIAKTIFTLASTKDYNSIYLGQDELKGCCPGGQAWIGYKTFLPQLKYFISTGTSDFRNGAAEYLLAGPDVAEKQLNSFGKITPLGKYTVIHKCEFMDKDDVDVKAILCFGHAEQIRNLCSLLYFRNTTDSTISIPWGPSCTSFISYPAGLIETNSNKNIIVGPTDPTGNYWFPKNYLSIGIPHDIASRMALDLDSSFIIKRPKVAYPPNHISMSP